MAGRCRRHWATARQIRSLAGLDGALGHRTARLGRDRARGRFRPAGDTPARLRARRPWGTASAAATPAGALAAGARRPWGRAGGAALASALAGASTRGATVAAPGTVAATFATALASTTVALPALAAAATATALRPATALARLREASLGAHGPLAGLAMGQDVATGQSRP